MNYTIFGLIFFTLAIICNALMDSVENEHVWNTIFVKKKKAFWWKRESAVKKVFGFKFDAWHITKHFMIAFIILFAVFYKIYFSWYIDFPILGLYWILIFNLFYNKIFGKS